MIRLAKATLATLAYTYVGYPALIEVLSRLAPHQTSPDPEYRPKVSVLIPVYNAKDYVAPKIESLLRQDYPKDKLEILIYSDASDDGSDEEVQRFTDRGPVRLIRGESRKGKPTALRVMRQIATGEVYVLTDIRQPLSENAISALVSWLADPNVGTVSGNLELLGETGAGFYWKYENRIRRAEARFRSMIGVTGPLYAIRAADFPELPEDIILDDMWIPLQLRLDGKKLLLCEEAVAYDQAFEDEREFGRKVRTLAGNFQLLSRMPQLLSPKTNPIFFETVSHKLLRLAGPALIITLAGATVAAVIKTPTKAAPWMLLGGQALFAAMAAAGPKGGKLASASRTFAVLNYAAALGFVRHIRGAQRVTW